MKPSDLYEIKETKLVRKNPLCPRCGPGTFMADHRDRFTCGKCGYTKWKGNQ
jgi:small subunit ribosomal protein S27Ae